MKIVGISPRLMTHENVEREFVNSRYVKQLISRELNAIMINIDNPQPEKLLRLCDCFLITGGYDIDPKYFGEENNGKSINCNLSMDKIDRQIVEHAKITKKPLLGICRGHQAINVFFGGTLYQDIGDTHRNIKEGHIVYTETNRLLPFNTKIAVNSYHHQAINRIAPDFDVIARAEDGTIEAIIHRHLPIIGIQWHPEVIPNAKESEIIFNLFAQLAKGK
ncbi:MAG: type 1 glutamine amidotransferase [Bacilli bacterium]|nr:type 1 glutamine amidotransferase [Bacilli bacterium]